MGGGSRATVAITFLVKRTDDDGSATIHCTDIGVDLTREQKLNRIGKAASLAGLESIPHAES